MMTQASTETVRPIVMSGRFWLGVYALLVIAPPGLLLAGEGPAPGGFWWDFALALGYASLAMTGLQFALTARFRRATAPFGIDLIYRFHRYLAATAATLLVVHALVLLLFYPEVASLTTGPGSGSLSLGAGWLALGAFILLVVSSLWRRPLTLDYDHWRRLHVALAVLGLAAAFSHVLGSASYLNSGWKYALWAGLGAMWLGLAFYVRLVRPVRLIRRPWLVAAVRRERGRSWTLTLEPETGQGLRFRPGQFAWLTLRASPFALREHPFSIASIPVPSGRIEFTIKELGDFTRQIGSVRPGERAWVDGPYGSFGAWRYPQAPGLVFIAGGAGIAPVMANLRSLAEQGDRRPLWLFYGNRNWERVVFREEIDALCARLELRVVHVLGKPPADWTGERGYIDVGVLDRQLPSNRSQLQYLVCGPEPMIRLVEQSLATLGVGLSALHFEIFDLA